MNLHARVASVGLALSLLGLAAPALAVSSASAAASAGTSIADPGGDVQVRRSASNPQEDTVDIRHVTYAVGEGRLVIVTEVVDLAQTPGNQFMETHVSTGGTSFDLVSELGKRWVKIFTGPSFYACKGASTKVFYGKDVVRQVVPVACLDASQVRLRSSAVLARNNGSPIARDTARRSGIIPLS
jgi:hypothetical protein